MLAKTSYKPVTLPGVEKPVTPLSPEGHYLFLPSDNNSLLLKSIAVSELMLPNDFQSSVERPSDSALSAVATCLDQVKFFFHIYIRKTSSCLSKEGIMNKNFEKIIIIS